MQCSEKEGREEKKEENKEGRREEEEGLQKEIDTRIGVLDDLDTSVEIMKMRLLETKTVLPFSNVSWNFINITVI